ncbi:MAG: radical SAM protein [Coriobacteriales bacterium]|jgi:hypothetical protein
MRNYYFAGQWLDAIDLKSWIVSRGVQVDSDVYESCAGDTSLSKDANRTTCLILSNGYTCALYDMKLQLDRAQERFSWTRQEREEFEIQMATPLRVRMVNHRPALTYHDDFIDYVTFPSRHDFYEQNTSLELPFLGNATILGNNAYVLFGYEWPCEFAQMGKPCQYCHAGNATAACATLGKPDKQPIGMQNTFEILRYAVENNIAVSVLYTGGSTLDGIAEHEHLSAFVEGMEKLIGRSYVPGEILFYLTPPKNFSQIDLYLNAGIDRVGMSIEVWNEKLARIITPGKMAYTTRERHLGALEYTAEKFGGHRVFSQLIIGCEPIESLAEGATWLAERGITPVFSILQQHTLKINGRTKPPELDIFRRAKELWLDLYSKYDIVPAGYEYTVGCIESEFYDEVHGQRHRYFDRPYVS